MFGLFPGPGLAAIWVGLLGSVIGGAKVDDCRPVLTVCEAWDVLRLGCRAGEPQQREVNEKLPLHRLSPPAKPFSQIGIQQAKIEKPDTDPTADSLLRQHFPQLL
jgi:hypothetical protein